MYAGAWPERGAEVGAQTTLDRSVRVTCVTHLRATPDRPINGTPSLARLFSALRHSGPSDARNALPQVRAVRAGPERSARVWRVACGDAQD
jgi:hypothetical protein